METIEDDILALLEAYSVNVSANHWIAAIPEDKYEQIAKEITGMIKRLSALSPN